MKALTPGSRIAVVAPSGPVPRERFLTGAARLRDRYSLIYSERLFTHTGFLAGDDAERLAELQAALRDPTVDAVWCARGGYGLMRILPALDLSGFGRSPKLLIGFSDVTALHAWAALRDLPSVHGPVITHLSDLPEEDIDAMIALLEGAAPSHQLAGLTPLVSGWATGRVIGGNLEIVTRLLGTPYSFDPKGALLVLEEVGERPYRVDRQLTQLQLAGWWSALVGIVVGDFHQCGDASSSPSVREVLAERLGSLTIPVALGAPVGHGARNRAFPLGGPAELDADRGTLTVEVPWSLR